MNPKHHLDALQADLRPLHERLLAHPLYNHLRDLEDLQVFQESHVFAVWDLSLLLKAAERELCAVQLPWLPGGPDFSRGLIESIIRQEECAADGLGGSTSRFELYLASMRQSGADCDEIEGFLARLERAESVASALEHTSCPPAVRGFVQNSWSIVRAGTAHTLAAAFSVGREERVATQFRALVEKLGQRWPRQVEKFTHYLEPHGQLDQLRCGPQAIELLCELCGSGAERWAEAEATARACLWSRLSLFDGVLTRLQRRRAESDSALLV